MHNSKRAFLKQSTVALASLSMMPLTSAAANNKNKMAGDLLQDLTLSIVPIGVSERGERVEKAQQIMNALNVNALVLEPGASMNYFSGINWWRSERLTSVIIPRQGRIVVICPAFEEPSIRESLGIEADIRVWNEHQSPFKAVAHLLKELQFANGKIAFEKSVRYFVVEGIMNEVPQMTIAQGDVIAGTCRLHKSANELRLMHKANEVTLAAYAYVWPKIVVGMSSNEINNMMLSALNKLGGKGAWAMTLVNKASALPHGTKESQTVREGSVVLMDCGCNVEGYQSDISRTFVVGEPTKQQEKIWTLVRHGQDIALQAAKLGAMATRVDDAVRTLYQQRGLGPGYQTPGLSHRTGHGIGMEVHEEVNLVHGEATKLAKGMCFSNEPGIYIPGEFGIRIEDCFYMTNDGPQWFTQPPTSLEAPIGNVRQLVI